LPFRVPQFEIIKGCSLDRSGRAVSRVDARIFRARSTYGAISLVDCDEQAIEAMRFLDRPKSGKRRPQQIEVSLGEQPDRNDTSIGVAIYVHEVPKRKP